MQGAETALLSDSGEIWRASISVDEENGVVEAYDLAYLLEYAFPFMEAGDVIWVDDAQAGIVVKSSLREEVIATGKQYLVQVNEDSRAVIEFELKRNN